MNQIANQAQLIPYNYERFQPAYYTFDSFEGPKVGQKAPDFTVYTMKKDQVKLSDFFGDWIVLEMGSITCPIYESKIKPMNKLASKFPDIKFLLLYVREAHPGEKIPQHATLTQKLACAKFAQEKDNEKRTIFIDDLEGRAHQMYGSMPNSIYIINPESKIIFRGDWNNIKGVKHVLSERSKDKMYEKDRFSARPYFGNGGWNMLGVLRRAGWCAVWDFVLAFPTMAIKHTKKLFRYMTKK